MTTSSSDPGRLRRTSPTRTLVLGDHRLTHVPDGHVQMHPRVWFADTSDEDWAGRADHLDDDGFLVGSIGGLLVEHDDRALLIDAGYGPHRVPAEVSHPALGRLEGGALLDGLRELGREPATIDTVALTHFHEDHVGWLARDGAPVFPNATLVASAAEWAGSARLPVPDLASERVVHAADGQEVFPGVTVWPTPGHTVGHTAFVITSGDQRLIAFGDAMHTPAQVTAPQWRSLFDHDHRLAARTRRSLVDELAQPGTFGYSAHFADALFGRVTGDPRVWQPVDSFS